MREAVALYRRACGEADSVAFFTDAWNAALKSLLEAKLLTYPGAVHIALGAEQFDEEKLKDGEVIPADWKPSYYWSRIEVTVHDDADIPKKLRRNPGGLLTPEWI